MQPHLIEPVRAGGTLEDPQMSSPFYDGMTDASCVLRQKPELILS